MKVSSIQGTDNLHAIIELFQLSLGEEGGLPEVSFWRWKHFENPFGVSPTHAAWDGDLLVGLRTFLCWRFACGSKTILAYRAVDTATHPDYRGRKLFTTLTRGLVEQLMAGPPAFVFNTPNHLSKSGYMKMGWQEWGIPRLAVRFFPTYFLTNRLGSPRWPTQSAEWSDQISDAWVQLAPTVEHQFADVFITDYSADYFRWRYFRQPKLNYQYWLDSVVNPNVLVFFRLKVSKGLYELRITDAFFRNRQAFTRMLKVLAKKFHPDVITYLADDGAVFPVPFGFVTLQKGLLVTFRELNEPRLTEEIMRHRKIYFSAGTLELF